MAKDYKNLKVGREFAIVQAKKSLLEEQTRSALAVLLVVSCLAALVAAAFFGEQTGIDDLLLKVWAVAAVPLTAVTGHYFRGRSQSGENNN